MNYLLFFFFRKYMLVWSKIFIDFFPSKYINKINKTFQGPRIETSAPFLRLSIIKLAFLFISLLSFYSLSLSLSLSFGHRVLVIHHEATLFLPRVTSAIHLFHSLFLFYLEFYVFISSMAPRHVADSSRLPTKFPLGSF